MKTSTPNSPATLADAPAIKPVTLPMGFRERAVFAAKYPIVTCDGHELSITNTCLVAIQFPSATVVGGFRQWLRHGRCVRKGEHGASIRVPCGMRGPDGGTVADPAAAEAGNVYFVAGTVFDVSQTCEMESVPGCAALAVAEMEVA